MQLPKWIAPCRVQLRRCRFATRKGVVKPPEPGYGYGHGYEVFFDIWFLCELLTNLLFNSSSRGVIESKVYLTMPINVYNEENCISFSSKCHTAGCSNFGPDVGCCGYDVMAVGRGGQEKVQPWRHLVCSITTLYWHRFPTWHSSRTMISKTANKTSALPSATTTRFLVLLPFLANGCSNKMAT